MLGNDVVDLRDCEALPGATHPRFDGRVFAASEQEAIRRSPHPARLRWTLWAAKESALKAAKKLDPRTIFSPRRFEVAVESDEACAVSHGDSRWSVVTRHGDGAVHAIAVAPTSERRESLDGFVRVDDGDPSTAVRRFAIDRIAAHLGIERSRLDIARRGRIPLVLIDRSPAPIELSLSHHGGVIAFAALFAPGRSS